MKIFEKLAALLFLVLMLGLVAFLTYVSVPENSEKVILIIIGGLMTESAKGVGKLVGGGEDPEKLEQRHRIRKLENEYAELSAKYETLHTMYNKLTETLLQHHVIHDEAVNKGGQGVK